MRTEWHARKWQRSIKAVMHVVYFDVHQAQSCPNIVAVFYLLVLAGWFADSGRRPALTFRTNEQWCASMTEYDCHRQIESRI